MAYLDLDEQQLTPEAEAESRRKMLGMLAATGKAPVLGRQPEQPGLQPGTRGYDLSVSATNQPTPSTPRLTPVQPPDVGGLPRSTAPVLGRPTQPARPDVMPTRADFPAKPVPTWQKVLGVAAAPFVPNLTGALLGGPRREADRQYQGAVKDWERGQTDAARAATTAETQARTKNLLHPPEKEGLTPEETTLHDLMTGDNSQPRINPNTQKPYTYLEAYSEVQGAKQGAKPEKPPNFEEATYQEWLKTHPGGTRMQFRKDLSAATEKPPKPERTMVAVPQPDGSSKVMEVTPGSTIPKGAQTVQQFGKEQTPNADEQRRADLANNLNENLDRLEEIVKRRPDLFGPVAGRMTSGKQWLGTSDPDVAALDNIKEQVGLAMVGAHAMRNAQHAEKAANSILNAYKNQPAALLGDRGSIASARNSLKTFIGDVEGKRVQDQPRGGNQPIELERGPDGKLRPKNAQR